MTLQGLKDYLNNRGLEDSVVFENPDYADAFVGISQDNRVIYDYDEMAECLVEQDGMSFEEAIEFVDYNTIRAIPYIPNGPIVKYNTEYIYDFLGILKNGKVFYDYDELVDYLKEQDGLSEEEAMAFVRDNKVNFNEYESLVMYNPEYADAFVGISHNDIAIFDYDKLIDCLINKKSMTKDEAIKYINEFEDGPIVIYNVEY